MSRAFNRVFLLPTLRLSAGFRLHRVDGGRAAA
jgi:hypothetical protein